jgi:quinoprotein glucose dehydrogenase
MKSICWFVIYNLSMPPFAEDGRVEILIADFEGKDYGNWTAEGKAFGPSPATGTLPEQGKVTDFRGFALVNSYNDQDFSKGSLTSPTFKIERKYLQFLIGGGRHPGQTCLDLLIDEKIVRTATGHDKEQLRLAQWDISKFEGQTVTLKIIDEHSGGWGHILIDHIVQSDEPIKLKRQKAKEPTRLTPEELIRQDKEVAGTFEVQGDFKIELFADRTQVANPVSFTMDEQGRILVAETFRQLKGVEDNRFRQHWITDDIASQTIEDRLAMYKKWEEKTPMSYYTKFAERIQSIEDKDGDGRADSVSTFADKFNHPLDGTGAGVLARNGTVYYTCIPHLYSLKDKDGDGKAEVRDSIQAGFGVRVSLRGHDMHGLTIGHDGRLYWSVGDRGYNITTKEGKKYVGPGDGAVFRCELDGRHVERVHTGLRNPMELQFDKLGNLFTVDNNQGGGDRDRLVYIVPGGETGWDMAHQNEFKRFLGLESDYWKTNPWFAEKMFETGAPGQPAWCLPAIAHIGSGPCGLAYNPGLTFQEGYKDYFFICNFLSSPRRSGIEAFKVVPEGAGFRLEDPHRFIWNVLLTDVDFGYDGKMYLCDWINGPHGTGGGRLFSLYQTEDIARPIVAETKQLIAKGFGKIPIEELAKLLAHPDMRVRQRAQFELAAREDGLRFLLDATLPERDLIQRLHGIWGIGIIGRSDAAALRHLIPILKDADLEVRANAAKVLGDERCADAATEIAKLLMDSSNRVRFFAAIAVGLIRHRAALPALLQILKENDDKDAYLRHAAVHALELIADREFLFSHIKDKSRAVRLGVLLSFRRLQEPRIAEFLTDEDPFLVQEAARATYDAPIKPALPALARLIEKFKSSEGDASGMLWRRVLRANHLVGKPENSAALIQLATSQASEEMRLEALHTLGDWIEPHPVDLLTGVYRPLKSRNVDEIADAVRTGLMQIIKEGQGLVLAKAVELSRPFKLEIGDEALAVLCLNQNATREVRAEVFKQLKERNSSQTMTVAEALLNGRDQALRIPALWYMIGAAPEKGLAGVRKAFNREGRRIFIERVDTRWEDLVIGPPSKTDYANSNSGNGVLARFVKSFVRPHKNAGAQGDVLTRINNGDPPQNDDDIHRNTWLDFGHARIILDLGNTIDVARINTYSWHRRERAGQKFTIFGSEEEALPDPNLLKLGDGWNQVAKIDTMRLGFGGMHASSVFHAQRKVGRYRWLMWDMPLRKPGLRGGTFISEIDVHEVGAKLPALPVDVTAKPTFLWEKQEATLMLGHLNHPGAAKTLNEILDRLLKGETPPELTLETLEAAALRKEAPIKEKLAAYNNSLGASVSERNQHLFRGGSSALGRKIFREKPEAQCSTCHTLKGRGGQQGPDLTGIGKTRDRAYLLRALLEPSVEIAPGFGITAFLLKDESIVEGVVLEDAPDRVKIRLKDGKEQDIAVEQIESRKPTAKSPMTPMGGLLSPREIRHLVEFLATQK